MRQHEDEPGGSEDRNRRVVLSGEGGDAALYDPGELGHEDHAEGPAGGAAGGAEADPLPAEVGAESESGAAPEHQQDERLGGDTEGRAAGEQRDLVRCPGRGIAIRRVGLEQCHEEHERCDHDDVVEHRRPGEGAEDPSGVEDLAEQAVQRVEEDLRQTPIGEGDREGDAFTAESTAFGGIERHEKGSAEGGEKRDSEEDHDAEGHDAVDELLTAVLMMRGTDDLRHEDRAQQTTGHDRVDVVGQLVGDGKSVGALVLLPDGPGERRRAHEAQGPGDEGSRGQQGAGTPHARWLGALVSHAGALPPGALPRRPWRAGASGWSGRSPRRRSEG